MMKKTILSSFIVIIFLLGCNSEEIGPLNGVPDNPKSSTSSGTHDFYMMTWNCKLLDTPDPLGINFGPQCEGEECRWRARMIFNNINSQNIDIVNLQEIFEDEAIDELKLRFAAAGYSYRYNKGAGLFTASKFPIESKYFEEYDSEHGWLQDGWDAHKDKGFLSTKIRIANGDYIWNINTHLDAGSTCHDQYVRFNQLFQLRDYIDSRGTSIPVLVSGDFNINVNDNSAPGYCSNNETTQLINGNGLSVSDLTSKNDYELLKQILGTNPVHEILNTTLSPTKTSGSSVIDYFNATNYGGKINFNSTETWKHCDNNDLRVCYTFEIQPFFPVNYSACFNYYLSQSEINDIMSGNNPTKQTFFIYSLTDDYRCVELSDHWAVKTHVTYL